MRGRSNAVGRATLTANVTTTTVVWDNANALGLPLLVPLTANAAAALATTYVSAITATGFVLSHANSATTDRSFGFHFVGG